MTAPAAQVCLGSFVAMLGKLLVRQHSQLRKCRRSLPLIDASGWNNRTDSTNASTEHDRCACALRRVHIATQPVLQWRCYDQFTH